MAISWKRIPQSFDRGTFTYSGKALISRAVYEMLEPEDISWIANDLKNYIKQKQGADFVQVYKTTAHNLRVIITDNKSQNELQEMRESGSYNEEEMRAMDYHEYSLDV